jgi:hypothetical protein
VFGWRVVMTVKCSPGEGGIEDSCQGGALSTYTLRAELCDFVSERAEKRCRGKNEVDEEDEEWRRIK